MTEEYKEPIFGRDYDQDDLEGNPSSIEYDIFVSPNDFNVKTLFDFIGSRVFKIPNFQGSYAWDIKRASKLIGSLLIGIPIPQIFPFEEKKNSFLAINGQQRLVTIYYFIKKRFPKKGKCIKLKKIFDEEGSTPDNILLDNDYLTDLTLSLLGQIPNRPNRSNKENYSTLEELNKTSFNLKTVQHTVIKSSASDGEGNNVISEIFNRLNTGNVNLKPQEIRTSLYYSNFHELLCKLDLRDEWRKLLLTETLDISMKEVEVLLCGFIVLINRESYKLSMTKFLNGFSFKVKKNSDEENKLLENIFNYFVLHINSLGDSKIFWTSNNKSNIFVYETVFTTLYENVYKEKDVSKILHTRKEKMKSLKKGEKFIKAHSQRTTSADNTQRGSEAAKRILLGNG